MSHAKPVGAIELTVGDHEEAWGIRRMILVRWDRVCSVMLLTEDDIYSVGTFIHTDPVMAFEKARAYAIAHLDTVRKTRLKRLAPGVRGLAA